MDLEPVGRFDWERTLLRCNLPEPVRLTAFMLATFANTDGTEVRPGLKLLQALRGRDERTCRRHIKTLEALGLLLLVTRGNQHNEEANVYRLTIPDDLPSRVEILDDPRTEHRTPWMSDAPASAPDTQVSGAHAAHPVDNPAAPDTQMSGAPPSPNGEHRTFESEHRTFEGGAPDTQVSTYQPPTPTTNTSHHFLSSCVVAEVEVPPADLETEPDHSDGRAA